MNIANQHYIYKPKVLLIILLIFLGGSSTQSQESPSYYQWLSSQLQNEHELNGEYFISPANEDEIVDTFLASHKWVSDIHKYQIDDFPFDKVLKIKVDKGIPQLWEINTKLPTSYVNKNDAILITFWLRNIWAQAEKGLVVIDFAGNKVPVAPRHNDWQQYFIRIKANIEGAQQLSLELGAQAQELEIAGFAVLNYGNENLDNLPQTDIISYRKPSSEWYQATNERIAWYRQGKLQVHVVDAYGNPVPNANVELKMLKHSFGFGTAVAAWRLADDNFLESNETYRQKIIDLDGKGHGFNLAVLENCLKWGLWEVNASCPNNSKEAIDWLLKQGIRTRGHAILWEDWQNENSGVVPKGVWQAVQDKNGNYLHAASLERINSILGEPGIQGKIKDWDVLNESVLDNAFAATVGESIHKEWFTLVKSVAPEVRRVISDTNILACGGLCIGAQERFYGIIFNIGSDNFEGIGMQSHINYPLGSLEHIYGVLDGFSQTFPEKDIIITEFDISIGNEQLAAEYFRDFLITAFSHPAVSDFLIWGFWDLAHWLGDAPLFRQDWSLKPAGEAFIDLVFNHWWTNEWGTTNENGDFFVNGYLGDYEIVVSYNDLVKTQRITLHQASSTGTTTTVTIQLRN